MKKMPKVFTIMMCAALAFTFWSCEKPVAFIDNENLGATAENPLAIPLTIEADSDGVLIVKNPWSTLKYKKNGGEAIRLEADENEPNSRGRQKRIPVSRGDKIEFFADGSENSTAEYPLNISCRSTACSVYGNVMSLLSSTNYATLTEIIQEKAFYQLFCDNHIKNHNEKNLLLPATRLTKDCYNAMFSSDLDITRAPILPATTLAEGCYESMFEWCPELTRAPELPAATLTKNCYKNVFRYCDKLNYVKCLATDISAEECTTDWLKSVSGTGTFVKADGTPWTSGDDGIPNGWTTE